MKTLDLDTLATVTGGVKKQECKSTVGVNNCFNTTKTDESQRNTQNVGSGGVGVQAPIQPVVKPSITLPFPGAPE